MKADFLNKMYIAVNEECPKVVNFLKLAKDTGAVPAYCYLGDQNVSARGDKKTMKFEDKNLETIITEANEMGSRLLNIRQ